ncbi:MAG: glycosyltransferase family 9 protein [Candidatus Omnitrophica bacterium]|nr:glycosyltransferase family 9 protein [Candidatus Omnitrophota bacterium]
MNTEKILIVNPFGIGDVIFSTPLIEILKNKNPSCFIGYICNKRAYEVIKSDPKIDKFFIYEKDDFRAVWAKSKMACLKLARDFLASVRREKFDIVIDLSLGYQYSLLLGLAGIKKRYGFNYKGRGRFLTKKIDIDGFEEKHVVEYYCEILKFMGIDTGEFRLEPRVYVTREDIAWADGFLKANGASLGDLLVGVIPGCGASWGMDARHRRWERGGFAIVCDGLAHRYGARVLLMGDARETEICVDIQGRMKSKAIMACGKTSLRNFLGLISRCALIITNDGGPLHMAVGLGLKTISIFGPVDEKIYGPYPMTENHAVIAKNDIPCRSCYKKFKYKICENRTCLTSIKPEDVLAAADRFLLGRRSA